MRWVWIAGIVLGLGPSCGSAFAESVSVPANFSGMQSQIDAIAAMVPQPASTVPPAEAIGGAAGAANSYRRGDAIQPRITRTGNVTLAADGTATFDWTLQGALSLVKGIQVDSNPMYSASTGTPVCWPTVVTATSASIKCTLLSGASLTIVGINLLQFASVPLPAGTVVGVIAIPGS